MYCPYCGTENKETNQFCTSCGQPLKGGPSQQAPENVSGTPAKPMPAYPQFQQPSLQQGQYQRAEYIVEQKLLSMTQTYKIKDIMGNEIMIARRKMSSIFNPKIEITSPDGNNLGYIQGNFFKTQWDIFDNNNIKQATITFPFFMFLHKTFEIETNVGMFRSQDSVFGKKFDAYDPNGRLAFTVDKKILSVRDSFKIISNGQLGPFITCLAAVVIDMKFYTK